MTRHLHVVGGVQVRLPDAPAGALDYTPAPIAFSYERALEMLARLGGHVGAATEADGGVCDDCGKLHLRRWRVGTFTVCRPCAARRAAAA